MLITSVKNPKIKRVCALRERRERDREGVTVLEGYRELSRSMDAGIKLTELYHCPDLYLGEHEGELIARAAAQGAEIYETTSDALVKMAYRDRPEGLIALAAMKHKGLDEMPVVPNGLYLDVFNPNCIRASTGAIFSVPLAETSSEEAVEWFRKHNIRTLAASPHSHETYTEVDMTQGIAIVVGAEQYGLTDYWMNNADIGVVIPMLGRMDSLNVATAATILLYEAARQRNWKASRA